MKLTSTQLRKIITEEIQNVINEGLDSELTLINNQLNSNSELAHEVLKSMVAKLPYMKAIEAIKSLSEIIPGEFDKALQDLKSNKKS